MDNDVRVVIAIIAGLAFLTAVEGVTYWNLIHPSIPLETGHPFLAATYLLDVDNVTAQNDIINISIRWTCWNDTWLRIEYVPQYFSWFSSNEVKRILVNQNDHFNLLLKPNTHAQVQFFAYSPYKRTNYTVTVNIYRDASKDLGPWGVVSRIK